MESGFDLDKRFGMKARDRVTGFEGTVIARAVYLYGCEQLALAPVVDKDGKISDSMWFDSGRIELLSQGVRPEDVAGPRPGGPNRDAPRAY